MAKRDYRNFSYRPIYGFTIKTPQKNRTKKLGKDICFADAFRVLTAGNTEYKGVYHLKCLKEFDAKSGNYCSLTKHQVLAILRYMRNTFDIKTYLCDRQDYYLFRFEIIGKPIKHKWVLTFSRVFFEFPYNEFAKDVFRIREQKIVQDGITYRTKNFLEVYDIIHNSFRGFYGGGHCLCCYPVLDWSHSLVKKRLNASLERVQDAFPGERKYWDAFNEVAKTYDTFYNIDWDEDFEERMKVYSKNFITLKQIKYENIHRR